MIQPKMFIGVWGQPMGSFQKWKDDGCNLLVGLDRENQNPPNLAPNYKRTSEEVRKAAKDLGLYYIDMPKDLSFDLESLIADESCLALLLPDEPEVHALPYNVDPVGFQKVVDDFIAKWKPFILTTRGRKKWWINFAGPKVTGGLTSGYLGQMQKPFGALADEICADWYPINMNTIRYWDQYNTSGQILPVTMVKALKTFFPNKGVWSYVEVCNQNLDKTDALTDPKNIGRGPTASEIDKQVTDLIQEGVSGIVYYAHRIGGGLSWDPSGAAGKTAWDGRDQDQQAKCKEIAVRVNGAAIDPLQKQIDTINQRLSAMETKSSKYLMDTDRVSLLRS